jgi:predicted solute-binding protein
LGELISQALEKSEGTLEQIGALHARRIGLTLTESADYLRGFNYRLGEREQQAIEVFQSLLHPMEERIPQSI